MSAGRTLSILAIAAVMLWAWPAAAEGDAAKGESIFIENCAPCHFEFKANGNNVGPNLSGVLGRRAGTFPGFNYSPAMRAAGHVWSEEILLRYLIAPKKLIPNIKMSFKGFPDAQSRRDVVAYIKKQQGQ